MAEPRGPEVVTDDGEDIVAAAFASYRSAAPEHFSPAPAGALMSRSARSRQPRRRALSLSMAGLAFTGLMVAGVSVAQNVASPDVEEPSVLGAGSETADGDADVSVDSSIPGASPSLPPSSPDPVEAQLLALSITLPAWPGELGERCPAGEYAFAPHDGPDGTTSNKPKGSPSPEEDSDSWVLLPGDTHAMRTDLDGKAAEEVIVPVACGDVPGVIALYHQPDSFDAVEFVYTSPKEEEPIAVAAVDSSTVTLSIPSKDSTTLRQFTFDGEQFTETTGTPPADEPSTGPSGSPGPSGEPSPTPSGSQDPPGGEDPGNNGTGDTGGSGTAKPDGTGDSSRSLESSQSPG
ncbi:hypothetical protein LX16_3982 [Stackebrandtia albiflava]|uniref:Uncharacterized protein n=1 Tax=Stackebrandtia albiflava TaxID=406432 RepID=A0A562UY93_9ACTN|nr:hypothetical protein [Stackebrandtia albiflava]TWJ10563.1 hypothetical protein LX16_3982 [Stackebrandtia albiflava]